MLPLRCIVKIKCISLPTKLLTNNCHAYNVLLLKMNILLIYSSWKYYMDLQG